MSTEDTVQKASMRLAVVRGGNTRSRSRIRPMHIFCEKSNEFVRILLGASPEVRANSHQV